jgi:aromatic ring-opening dioxygenase catalytic subunit (LigB family)
MPPPRQPTLFISHGGGPCWLLKGGLFAAMDSASPSATFIRGLARHLPAPPAAVLVVSAHWEAARGGGAQGVELLTGGGSGERHALFYDYYGFPREAYGLEWSPPAAPPALVARVRALLTAAGFAPRESRTRAGLDHGVFLPLMLAFPAAEVPVLQLSLLALPSPPAEQRAPPGASLPLLSAPTVGSVDYSVFSHSFRTVWRITEPGG